MAYRPRDESPGYHHVVTRGNNKRSIVVDDDDRATFCRTVNHVALKYGWTVLAYCLMDNHYHLVLVVRDKGLAAGMCELNTRYAVMFNMRHGRVNHLFGKRYWNRRIRTQPSMLNVVRYVVRNPRAAGGSQPLHAYRWTSYAATLGLAYADIKLDRDAVLAFFGSTPRHAVEEFRMYCSAAGLSSSVQRQPP